MIKVIMSSQSWKWDIQFPYLEDFMKMFEHLVLF